MGTEMATATATKLVSQTFVEDLHAQQELVKKEFAELKKVDSNRQNQKKLREKAERNKGKNEYMVFNYLWHYFPNVMATKNQDPEILRQEMGDSEFERILKKAKHFYGFRAYTTCVVMGLGFIGTGLAGIFGPVFGSFSGAVALCMCPLLVITWDPYFSPNSDLSIYESDRRDYLRNLYKNSQKQNE